MVVFRRFYILWCLTLSAVTVSAQYDPEFSHYWAMESSFNPAAIGKDAKLNVAGAYAIQLAGFENNPKTMYAGADMPVYALNTYHGLGVQFMNDAIGLFSHKRFGLQYAFQPQLFGGKMSLGVQATLFSETFDASKVDVNDSGDPVFSGSGEANGTALDLSVGVYYKHRNWYAGVSALHFNAPTVELGEKNELDVSTTYYLTGGYNIRMKNPFLTIHTSFLGRTDGVAYRADISGRLMYNHEKRVMYAGLSYSPTNSITVLIGGDMHGVRIGYSYEIYTSAIQIGNGSHELFVGYQTDINLYKKGRNLHKSVRIL